MKKIFLVSVLVISNLLNAQVKFGLKGGLNLADVSQGINVKGTTETENVTITANESGTTSSSSQTTTENIDQTAYVNTSAKISFYLGGFMELPINKKGNLSLKTELLYCHNGATIDKRTLSQEDENLNIFYTSNGGSYTIGQLDIPVLLKFTTNKKFAILGGLHVGAILFAKSTENNGNTVDESSKLKPLDLGINLGASYPITKNMAVEIMYFRGLLDIDKSKINAYDYEFQGLLYNRTLHIGLEYSF